MLIERPNRLFVYQVDFDRAPMIKNGGRRGPKKSRIMTRLIMVIMSIEDEWALDLN